MAAPLWQPSQERIDAANITRFMAFVNRRHGLAMTDYAALYDWSVSEMESFWAAVWDFCRVIAKERGDVVLAPPGEFSSEQPPGARWFPGARLNFSENLLRYRDDKTALVSLLENGRRRALTYGELYRKVASLAASLKAEGVQPGDRVAGFMPNIPETVIAMLATASIGATWSSCSPDFGINGVMDRFGQIEPVVLFTADGYFYNGKTCDSLERVREIAGQISSLKRVVVVPLVEAAPQLEGIARVSTFDDYLTSEAKELEFPGFAFDHPLYIMYSSGTTGSPNASFMAPAAPCCSTLKNTSCWWTCTAAMCFSTSPPVAG